MQKVEIWYTKINKSLVQFEAREMSSINDINGKLNDLQVQHRILDDQIVALEADQPQDQLKIQRLKRQKLTLKDKISRLQTSLLPDIIA